MTETLCPATVTALADARRLYPAPGNKRAYLQQPGDALIVTARPDLKFQLYPAIADTLEKTGVGFVLVEGTTQASFDYERVEQSFDFGALPLLTQRVTQAGFHFTLESFTTRDPRDRGLLLLRMTVWRTPAAAATVDLSFLATQAPHEQYCSHPNEDYIPFEPWGAAWEQPHALIAEESCLHDGQRLFAVCTHSAGITVRPVSGQGTLAWSFHIAPTQHAPETLEIVLPYPGETDGGFPIDEREALQALSFTAERKRQRAHWLGQLARGTQLEVPETDVQDIFRTLTLNSLQFLGSTPGEAYLKPGQGGYHNFSMVYGWESAFMLTQLAQQGYAAEVSRVLDYLLTTQHGHQGPEGDISDADGCFRPHIHWMNETGAVLRIFADYAFASGDFARLRNDADALLKAARWIQRQRQRTRDVLPDGTPARHYGLLPKGRPHDWPLFGYFIFTDANSWRGLHRLAEAFAAAGLPDAGWLREEADDYRQCILSAVRRAVSPHPLDPALVWVPCELYEDPATAIETAIFCGPHALLDTGILDPGDPLIAQIEAAQRAVDCLNDHFAFRMRVMEDETLRALQTAAAGGSIDLYYVTFAEAGWHRNWLAGGEWAKAQSIFYLTLAYSVSRDLHMAQERFSPQLPWLLPWQPNASANGRILQMIVSNLCFVAGDTAHLFYGVPDTWFASEAPIGVDGLWIGGGPCAFRLASPIGTTRRFTYACHGGWVPARLILALPDPHGGRTLQTIETNGAAQGTVDIAWNG